MLGQADCLLRRLAFSDHLLVYFHLQFGHQALRVADAAPVLVHDILLAENMLQVCLLIQLQLLDDRFGVTGFKVRDFVLEVL